MCSAAARPRHIGLGEPLRALLDPLAQDLGPAVELIELPERLVPHLDRDEPHDRTDLPVLGEARPAGLDVVPERRVPRDQGSIDVPNLVDPVGSQDLVLECQQL